MLFLPFGKKTTNQPANPKPNRNPNNKIYYETGFYGVPYVLISNEESLILSDEHITNSDLNMVMGWAYLDMVVEECFSRSFYFV